MKDDTISRAAAIDALKRTEALSRAFGYHAVIDAVEALPSVDAVPVVRCKDCKHHHYSVCEIPYCDRIDYGYGWKDEDFCSRGERKDGEQQ